ncbi:hypothetical protein RC74_12440 [Falsihalocynthiibacter arcticus]|uniref:Uncharacterized protein n=1 Tax=Falsihalocynthiibacter arcticus TaxID=1579316 RepID=A0A126V2P0_9RHOB|nr:hypothetical protein RC74_12440 [Falsihalocynthiibacter arcticus]
MNGPAGAVAVVDWGAVADFLKEGPVGVADGVARSFKSISGNPAICAGLVPDREPAHFALLIDPLPDVFELPLTCALPSGVSRKRLRIRRTAPL